MAHFNDVSTFLSCFCQLFTFALFSTWRSQYDLLIHIFFHWTFSTCFSCQNKSYPIFILFLHLWHLFGQWVPYIRFPFILPLHTPLGILIWLPKTALYLHYIQSFLHRFERYHVTPPLPSSFLCLPVAFGKYRLLSIQGLW